MAASNREPLEESSFRYMIRDIIQERGRGRVVRNVTTQKKGKLIIFYLLPKFGHCFVNILFVNKNV